MCPQVTILRAKPLHPHTHVACPLPSCSGAHAYVPLADHARSNSLYSNTPAAVSTAAWQRSSEPTRRRSRTWRKAYMCRTCTLAAPPTVQGCSPETSSQVRRCARADRHRSPGKPLRCNNFRRKHLRCHRLCCKQNAGFGGSAGSHRATPNLEDNHGSVVRVITISSQASRGSRSAPRA